MRLIQEPKFRVYKRGISQIQQDEYKNGKALTRHVNSAHGGLIDENCRACKEIQTKFL